MKIQIQITGWGKAPDEPLASTSFGSRGRSPHQFLFNRLTKAIQRAVPVCFALLLLALPAMVQAQFTYTTNNSTITITGYTGSGGAVSIPATINGLPVTSVGEYAFEDATLTSVTIPDSVTSIGNDAFVYCALTSVIIPDSVTSLGDESFESCFSLTNVTIGNGVTSIGDGAFLNCQSLISAIIGNGVTNIEGSAFGSWNRPLANLTSIYFTGNAPAVDPYAFVWYTPLGGRSGHEPVTIYYMSGTTGWSGTFATQPTVMLEGPPQFGTTADGWSYLNDQIANAIVTRYAGSNQVVIIPSVINGLPVTGIGRSAFEGAAVTSVTIPNSVTSIGEAAFEDCESLVNVTIPNSVTSIGDFAFEDCYNLTSVAIGNSVTSIGDDAFQYCESLTQVTIPNSVTRIGDGAFEVCNNLTSVFFMGNAPTADSSAFYNDFFTTAYYLPGTLGWNDFSTNTGLYIAQWFLPNPLILNKGSGFGVQSYQFSFTISWATNVPVVVEACTNLSNPVWLPVSTNTLVGGTSYFNDPQSASLPGRFYRLRSQ